MTKSMHFEAVAEPAPGPIWQARFRTFWPAYRRWFTKTEPVAADANAAAVARERDEAAIERHMPELRPLYRSLVALAGDDPLAARFLSAHRPPPYLSHCSQFACTTPDGPVLVRNYDLDPDLNEGLILRTEWLKPVIATSEFLWGVADGMNGDGLAVSLAFGGRSDVGDGFGMPLILRYVLETCRDTADAIEVLARVPSHMAYNITLNDRGGHAESVEVAPGDAPLRRRRRAIATNHQWGRADDARARRFLSAEREATLDALLNTAPATREHLVQRFLDAPLFSRRYDESFGTLYTTTFEPATGAVTYHWPDAQRRFTFDAFEPAHWTIEFASTPSSGWTIEPPAPTDADMPATPAPDEASIYADIHAELLKHREYVPRFVLEAFADAARRGRFGG